MSGLLVFFDSEHKCADRLRHVRWHNCTACPHCQSYNVKKDGRIPYRKCYLFIRTVMEKIASLSNTNVKLKDTVESDEFYIKAGLKGRPYHEEIIKIGRKPRRRGLKPWKGRGTFEKDHPMITCI